MGWNTGYTIFEETVVGAYDLGLLNKDLLEVLMRPYAGSDIDSGGSCDLRSKDGKPVEEIVLLVHSEITKVMPDGDYYDNPDEWDEYHESVSNDFWEIAASYGW